MAGADVDPRSGAAARQGAGVFYLIGSSHELMQNVCNYFYEMAKASRRQTNARCGELDLRAKRDLSQKMATGAMNVSCWQLTKTGRSGNPSGLLARIPRRNASAFGLRGASALRPARPLNFKRLRSFRVARSRLP
jgi:hypothetical protein